MLDFQNGNVLNRFKSSAPQFIQSLKALAFLWLFLSKKVLKRALKDGMISPDEEEMLEEFRERYIISMEQHEKMHEELTHNK